MCFSDIPPGQGTSRNENLHKNLNRYLKSRPHISSEVMLALLHSFFYKRNCKIIGGKSMESSVNAVKNMCISTNLHTRPTIGFPSKEVMGNWTPQYFYSSNKIDNIVLRTRKLVSASEKMPNISHLSAEEMVIAGEFKNLPVCDENQDTIEHMERVDKLLDGAGLKRVGMPRDGNCIFHTVGFTLKNTNLTTEYQVFLRSIHVNDLSDLTNLAYSLRQATVQDLIRNYEFYKFYVNDLSEESYIDRVKEFQTSGSFAGDMGDLLIAGLANALMISINIVGSHRDVPFLHIQPRDPPMNNAPLTLAYIACGPGHYDGTEVKRIQSVGKHGICICGRRGNVACHTKACKCFHSKVSCGIDPSCRCRNCQNRYGKREDKLSEGHGCRCGEGKKNEPVVKPCSTTRCICYLRGEACISCGCKFCGNKHGSKGHTDKGTKKTTPKKLATSHKNKLPRSTSAEYLKKNDFVYEPMKWTLQETILLNQILKEKKGAKPNNAKQICMIFNDAVSKHPELGGIKSKGQIQQKIAHMAEILDGK